MPRTPEQNMLNIKFFGSIQQHRDELFEKFLAEGAEIEEIPVWDSGTPGSVPIINAIMFSNLYAVKALLKNKASLSVTTVEGIPIMNWAVRQGNERIVQTLLMNGADPNSYNGRTALETGLMYLNSLAVIENSDWGDKALKQKLLDWFFKREQFASKNAKQGVAFPLEPGQTLRAHYYGSLDIISLLLAKEANPFTINDSNYSLLDIIKTPEKYWRSCGGEGLKYLGAQGDTLTFEFLLENYRLCGDNVPYIPVIVDFDFSKIRAKLLHHVSFNPKYKNVDMKTLQESMHMKISQTIQEKIDEQNPIEKKIKELEKKGNLEAFFDEASRPFSNMLDIYRLASQGFFKRDDKTNLDRVAVILLFVGGNAPSPFSYAFTLLSAAAQHVSDHLEEKRYQGIARLLPNDKSMQAFAREQIYFLTMWMQERLGGVASVLSRAEMVNLSKRAFVVAIHAVYESSNLEIDAELSANQRTELLSQGILNAVKTSTHLNQLVESTLKQVNDRIHPAERVYTPMANARIAVQTPMKQEDADTLKKKKKNKRRCVVM